MNAPTTYNKAFFHRHLKWRADYRAIADILARTLDFESVLDLGCGSGYLLARLHELGKSVRGVDASTDALASVPHSIEGRVSLADLTRPLHLGRFDLVICSEVAEHLESQFADGLVETICNHARRWVYFTAAPPGQGGLDHLNEQPSSYWVVKFEARGCHLLVEESRRFQAEVQDAICDLWWFARNSMLLAVDGRPGAAFGSYQVFRIALPGVTARFRRLWRKARRWMRGPRPSSGGCSRSLWMR